MRILPGSGDYVAYNHRHTRDGPLLENSGWHCTFCFPTLEEIRSKMKGYSHNDRLSSLSLLGERTLRKKVCTGQDPFGMWPVSEQGRHMADRYQEAFSFRDLIIESFDTRPLQSFDHLPLGLKQYPGRFPYLVNKGCERPNK
jgi:beta-1,4-mannosyl-glycoprotein beta-1,4-N-acetylglucosaminyltransferase